ncbi:hypothetical protein B6N13_12455 [Marinomonas sp. UCMA 3892]|uniref:hypothetical protein n=1 Tax=Marinomonas sp. UCMA 3892 TaxID=1972585 RepID=UPI001469F7B8|nr:hypothetical protein [Marinomonas sp. UCMA 3892]NLU98892.1 hypothetical protein [Marinomonas sp. UCMA 3892]
MDLSYELVECPKCKDLIRPFRLKMHLKKVHTPEAEAKRIKAAAELRKAEIEFNAIVSCSICKCSVKRKNLTRHLKNVHGCDMSIVVSVKEPAKNKFNSVRERKAFWKKMLGPDTDDEPQGLFEKKLVLNGGAYGLGRSRKH